MKTFACPHCPYKVETIGTEAWHDCRNAPGRKSLVQLEQVDDKMKTNA